MCKFWDLFVLVIFVFNLVWFANHGIYLVLIANICFCFDMIGQFLKFMQQFINEKKKKKKG